MKTVASFSKPEEAHLFRMRLENAGIPAFIRDENMVQMDWLCSNAIGGVRVQVEEEDLEAVQAFLAEERENAPVAEGSTLCPFCGSHDVGSKASPRRPSLLATLFHLLLPAGTPKRNWTCQACQKTWQE